MFKYILVNICAKFGKFAFNFRFLMLKYYVEEMMVMSLFRKLFDYDVKELKRFEKLANDIEALDEEFQSLSDEELKNKTVEFKDRLKNGSTLDDIVVEAFATAREACFRVIGEKPYHVQLLGGLALHYGNIAEMKTGEGKNSYFCSSCIFKCFGW